MMSKVDPVIKKKTEYEYFHLWTCFLYKIRKAEPESRSKSHRPSFLEMVSHPLFTLSKSQTNERSRQ